MKIGTKSVLFGVHQFIWHPLTVLLAWCKLYKSWPRWPELIAIVCHDLGYWGCADIDGPSGKGHPWKGALWTARVVSVLRGHGWLSDPPEVGCYESYTFFFTLLHSRDMARCVGRPVSRLYAADKACIFYDPKWFYLLRARLSGEITEFKHNAIGSGHCLATVTDSQWFDFYRENIRNRPGVKELL